MAPAKKQEQVFHSIAELDRKYFPELSPKVRQSKESDPETLGRMLARSTFAQVKELLCQQQALGE